MRLLLIVYYSLFYIQLSANINVLITVKPIHSIVTNIMMGIAKPILLIAGKNNPHNFKLKKSHLQKTNNADLIIMVNQQFEHFLNNMHIKKTMQISDICGLDLIKYKYFAQIIIDPHIWLDLDNLIIIAQAICDKLCNIDKKNAITYKNNTAKLQKNMIILKGKLAKIAEKISHMHFLALHDGYKYFSRKYNLCNVVSGKTNCGGQLGIKSYNELREVIQDNNVKAIFVESLKGNKMERHLQQEFNLPILQIDPLGANIPSGPNQYSELLQSIFAKIIKCQKQLK